MADDQDPELLAGFLDEAEESLATVGRLFVELERDPGALQVVEAIFRPVHSLKGNAAFFGLLTIKRVAHEMETVLDHVRKGRLTADRAVIDVLLAGLDLLVGLIGRIRGGGTDDDPAAVEPLSVLLTAQAARAGVPASADPAADLLLIEQALPPANQAALAALGRLRKVLGVAPAKDVLPASLPTGLTSLILRARSVTLAEDESKAVLAGLERLRDAAPDATARALAQETLDGARVFIDAMGFEAAGAEFVSERLARMAWNHAAPAPSALEPQRQGSERIEKGSERIEKGSEQIRKDGGDKSMRVAESAIDTFLHYVGELVVVGDMFRHLQTRVVATPGMQTMAREFRRANETFAGLSNQLQRSIMGIRKVPVKPLAHKVPRLVRDVSQAIGKEIDVVIEGEGAQVDKSLLELLDSPLTHMVRNAVDHGIETPERREATGKPRRGTITVAFAEQGRSMTLSVSDDGAGLNLEAIRKKGEAIGLIAPGAPLQEQDIVNLIFASGLSTAAQVTEISGRGVGMDVVKRAIEAAGGAISITTTAGKGSRFAIKLPIGVTTQIVGGYLVKAGAATYVLPLERVRETFRARPEDRKSLASRGVCLLRRDLALPMFELGGLLGGRTEEWPKRGLPVVVVEANRRPLALAVTAVIGVQKVVVRRLAGLPPGAPMLSGAALLGDGHLALILDLDQLHISTEPAVQA